MSRVTQRPCLARRFGEDASGALAIMFGLALVPLMLLVGATLDYTRASSDRVALQRAVDAAVIAASRERIPNDQRTRVADEVFLGSLSAAQQQQVKGKSFTLDANLTRVTGWATAETPTTIMNISGWSALPISVSAEGIIAQPRIRQLDLAMCIDASGSMDALIAAVKTNALNFEANLNAELQRRGLAPFDAMRVRVIFFRDYGGSYVYRGPSYFNPYNFPPDWGGDKVPVWQQNAWVWVYLNDPNRFKYVGDNPAMRISSFWKLPAERTLFSDFAQPEAAWGGGDAPESGLECVNEALDSPWARVGDLTPSGQPLNEVFPVVAVWTDEAAHPPSWAQSLLHPSYPPPSKMPRDHQGLLVKWNDPTKIDQVNRMLVFFGDPDRAGAPNGWPPLKAWPGFMIGGTLQEGTDQMVRRLVDAIVNKLNTPILSQ